MGACVEFYHPFFKRTLCFVFKHECNYSREICLIYVTCYKENYFAFVMTFVPVILWVSSKYTVHKQGPKHKTTFGGFHLLSVIEMIQ